MTNLPLALLLPALVFGCTKFQTASAADDGIDAQHVNFGDSVDAADAVVGSVDVPMPPEVAAGCASDQKRCGGLCANINDPKYGCDGVSCDASACPADVGATLKCQGLMCVIGSCAVGSKLCGGKCVSLSDPTFGCGATTCDASSCPNPGAGGSVICQGSACVIGTCPSGNKKCGEKCVAVADPTYGCGATTCDAMSCPAAGTGTLICQGGACVVGTCGAGTKKCGDKCVTTDVNNGCSDATRCTACANNQACMGTPTTCQCVPLPMGTACAGKCDSVGNGCGGTYGCGGCSLPSTCGGGGVANVCGCKPVVIGTVCAGKCGSVSDGCGGMYSCSTCTAPPNATATCQNNQCVLGCAADTHPVSCGPSTSPVCGRWSFESSGPEGWFAADGGPSGTAWDDQALRPSTKHAYLGLQSLAVGFRGTGNTDGTSGLFLHAPICPGLTDVGGRRLRAKVWVDADSSLNNHIVAALGVTTGSSGANWVSETGYGDAVPGTWIFLDGVIPDNGEGMPAAIVEIYVLVDLPWTGTIYIDEVRLD